jgi:hypothetical protein
VVDKAADYGLTHRVVVLGDGENQPILVASAGWLEAMQSFQLYVIDYSGSVLKVVMQ